MYPKSIQPVSHLGRNQTHRRWMSAIGPDNKEEARLIYTRARSKVKTLMRQTKIQFESNIALKSKSDPKVFWSHIRTRLKTKTGVAPLLESITDPTSIKFRDQDKANILQKQFSNVFTLEPEDEVPKLPSRTNVATCEQNITDEMVKEEILKLKSTNLVAQTRFIQLC